MQLMISAIIHSSHPSLTFDLHSVSGGKYCRNRVQNFGGKNKGSPLRAKTTASQSRKTRFQEKKGILLVGWIFREWFIVIVRHHI